MSGLLLCYVVTIMTSTVISWTMSIVTSWMLIVTSCWTLCLAKCTANTYWLIFSFRFSVTNPQEELEKDNKCFQKILISNTVNELTNCRSYCLWMSCLKLYRMIEVQYLLLSILQVLSLACLLQSYNFICWYSLYIFLFCHYCIISM